MGIVVQKFGGTSVVTPELRTAVAHRIARSKETHDVVVVVSAMGRQGDPYATDTLVGLLEAVGKPDKRDLDLVMACGELISASLLATTLRQLGINAIAMTGWQAGIITDATFGDARIITVKANHLQSLLAQGIVPIVAGFQGATDIGDITTLGRGGSDTSAAAIGVAVKAERVEIFTDVDGIMTADPRLVPEARVLNRLDYADVFQMATQGSKVIHPRAVELAMQRNIPLVIKSTLGESSGSVITNASLYEQKLGKTVTAVAHIAGVSQIDIRTPNDDGTMECEIFYRLAGAGVSVDLINVSPLEKKFIVNSKAVPVVYEVLGELALEIRHKSGCAKVSVVGTGMRGVPGVMAKVVKAMREINVRILQTSDSHLSISVLVEEADMQVAVRTLHQHFGLDSE